MERLIDIMFSFEGLAGGAAWVLLCAALTLPTIAVLDFLDRRRLQNFRSLNMRRPSRGGR